MCVSLQRLYGQNTNAQLVDERQYGNSRQDVYQNQKSMTLLQQLGLQVYGLHYLHADMNRDQKR